MATPYSSAAADRATTEPATRSCARRRTSLRLWFLRRNSAVSGGFFGAGVFFVESGQAPGQLPNETIFEPLATAQSVKTLDEESFRFRRASQIDQALRSIDIHTDHVDVILIEMLPHDVVRLPIKRLGPGRLALIVENAGEPRRRDADNVMIGPMTASRDAGGLPLGTLRVVELALLAEEARVRI